MQPELIAAERIRAGDLMIAYCSARTGLVRAYVYHPERHGNPFGCALDDYEPGEPVEWAAIFVGVMKVEDDPYAD